MQKLNDSVGIYYNMPRIINNYCLSLRVNLEKKFGKTGNTGKSQGILSNREKSGNFANFGKKSGKFQ